LISCYNAYCQEIKTVEKEIETVEKWQEYIEELMEDEEEDSERLETLYNDLSEIADNPFNLNTVTAEQLQRLPFLTENQANNILTYRQRQNKFVSIYELKNIPLMDIATIQLVLPFLYVGEAEDYRKPTLKNILNYGKNELTLKYDRNLNSKSGYGDFADSILQKYPNRKYVGEPFYTSLRYNYTYYNNVQAGFIAEKDAGEAFMNSKHKGYDFYSAHLVLKDMGIVRTFVAGDYKISFGQGLVVSNDFTPSRSSILSQAERRNNGFRRHYSTNETNFFRGAATTVSLGKIDVSAFYSYRYIDASVNEGVISSFKTDGLHRTEGDLSKKNAASVQSYGGNVRYVSPQLLAGVTAMSTAFGGLSSEPSSEQYNMFYFRGKRNTNISADYSWRLNRMTFFGETAMSQNNAIATLNGLQWSVSTALRALILYRNYSRHYQALYGSAFGQNSGVNNEEGLYMSLQWAPIAYWRFSGYVDMFRFPWLKYDADAPSSGKEYMLQTEYTRLKHSIISIRYRYRMREKNVTGGQETVLEPSEQHRLRLQMTVKPTRHMTLRTTAEGNVNDGSKHGYLVSQNVGLESKDASLKTDLYLSYFNTDDYYTRIISKEKNMLYTYYSPFLYGEGVRMATVFNGNLHKRLYLSLKLAWTHYFDRNTIGSGTEAIAGKNKTDITLQFRWKF
jgi:hypothetical protein